MLLLKDMKNKKWMFQATLLLGLRPCNLGLLTQKHRATTRGLKWSQSVIMFCQWPTATV